MASTSLSASLSQSRRTPAVLPTYIYKIIPHHSIAPRYAFPIPIPASHEFAVSELDAKVSPNAMLRC